MGLQGSTGILSNSKQNNVNKEILELGASKCFSGLQLKALTK